MKFFNTKSLLLLLALFASALAFQECKKDDDTSDAIVLNSFGPSPALRGGKLRFIGTNLDKVTAIVLPDGVEVKTFEGQTATEITLTIPQATVNGIVTLKTPQGDLNTKTELTISEPIALTAFGPAKARPGDVITLQGTYLNLIKEVIFANKKAVATFVSQSADKIEVKVPDDAQTGLITLSNGATPEPILVESATPLDVTLPAITSIAPQPVKAGQTLTLEGTDLDLVKEIVFQSGLKVTTFVSQTRDKIEVAVPADAKEGTLSIAVASLVSVTTTQTVALKVPTIANVSPDPVKNGASVVVKGTDLDLVRKVTFGGNKDGQLESGGTETEIRVKTPDDAPSGILTFTTAAGKTVTSATALTFVKPVVSSLTPSDIQANKTLSIAGDDLDLVVNVRFNGGKEAKPTVVSNTELQVTVPVGAETGLVTVVAKNGDEVSTAQSLTILPSVSATVTDMPSGAKPGQMIDIKGVHLDEITEVIFPANVPATMFGQKSANLIQVVIPKNVKTGVGRIKLITTQNEVVETPEINIQGVDPVADPSLVFFNFDGLDSWWGDAGAKENDPSLTLNGTNYHRVNKVCNGWTGFFWRNGANNFPGSVVGSSVNQYVLKFDVNVLEPITGGEFAWRLKGSEGDFWYRWAPWNNTGSYKTDGWITVTVPLTAFSDGSKGISNLSSITEDFGVAFNSGMSQVNVCLDNIRLEKL